MSDHEAKHENNEMAAEDSVKVEEEKPKEKVENQEENEKEPKEDEDEDEEESKEVKDESEKEEDENEVKEEEEEDEKEEEMEAEDEEEEEKEKEKAPKQVRKRQKKEEAPAKETPSTPKKESDVPLYDQPLEMSGKRDRKKVERFVQETKKEELNTSGSGTAFGDIPFIDAMITKMTLDELKVLHRVAFNRPGSGNEIKKNLRKFNGFPYTKDDKKYQSKLLTVERILMSELKRMLMILGLERQGNKSEVVERLMAFMLQPEDMGKKPPASAKKPGKVRGRPSKKGREKKQNNTSRDDSASSGSGSDQSGSEEEDDEDKEEEEEEEEEEKKPKKTPGRKPAAGKKTPAKRTPAAKKTPATKRARPAVSDDDSDSDDEPLAKKVKQPPTDAELKVMVKKILEGANLEEVTMKSVCRQVYDSYPDFDLTHKKVFIKETVKSIIS